MNKRKWFILRPLSNERGGSTLEYTVVIAGALILAIVLYQVVSGEGASKVKDTVATILKGGTIEIAGGGGPNQSSPSQSSKPKPPAPKPPQPKKEEKDWWEQGLELLGKGLDYATQPVQDLAGATVEGVKNLGNFAADTVKALYQSTEERSKLPYKKGTIHDIQATDMQLRWMADLSYKSEAEANGLISKTLGDGWSIIETTQDPSGFQAMVFRNQNTKEVIIAYRGTDEKIDAVSDAEIVFNETVAQKKAAEEFTKKMLAIYPDAKFTGHSLGGYLAQMMSVETGRPAVTWNAVGAKPHPLRNALTPKMFWDGLRSTFNPSMNLADDIENVSGKYHDQIRNYVNSNDAVGKYGVHYGQVIIVDDNGNTKEINDYSLGQQVEDNIAIKIGLDGGELSNNNSQHKRFPHHGLEIFDGVLKQRQNIVSR